MPVDLHSHSTASDGTLTPDDLVRHAAALGVTTLALTDHDTTAGIGEARESAHELGVELVAGVEISVSWQGGTVHVLGLNVDADDQAMQLGLSRLREYRVWRAEEIGRRLAKAGIEDAFEGARRHARGAIVGRTHFAHFLVEQGHAKTPRDVFKRFLVRGKPGHIRGEWAELDEAMGWIRGAGGQAVIAHPARYPMSSGKLRRLLDEFRGLGGAGLEVVSGSHAPEENRRMAQLAQRYELLASRGSDYHGPENPWIELGRIEALPAACRPIWESAAWLASKQETLRKTA